MKKNKATLALLDQDGNYQIVGSCDSIVFGIDNMTLKELNQEPKPQRTKRRNKYAHVR